MHCQECGKEVTENDCTFGGLHRPCDGRVFNEDKSEYLGILGKFKKREVAHEQRNETHEA